MKLKQQVCARKYSEKLKELGVKQKSLWYWFEDHKYVQYKNYKQWGKDEFKKAWGLIGFKITEKCISAFTVAELELPYPYVSGKCSLNQPICFIV